MTLSSLRRAILSAFFVVITLLSSQSKAQLWTQIGALGPATQDLHCVFFWNSQRGIAVGPFQGMWIYKNGIWTHNASYTGLVPQSIRFIQGVLYATCYLESWKSLDSGATWQPVNLPELYPWDSYLAGDGTVHGFSYAGGLGWLDQNIFAATKDDANPPLYSTDGGLKWLDAPNAPNTTYGWGFYADTCRKEFFAMGEEGGTFYSLDSGRSWYQASPETGFYEDLMEGADGTMYHFRPTGFYRSIDAGYSWDFIGGPSAQREDYHFQAFGPHGDTIIATVGNQVWKCAGASQSATPDMPIVFADTNIPCGATTIPILITPYGRRLTSHLHIRSSLRDIDTSFVANPGSVFYVWLKMDSSQTDETVHIRLQASEKCQNYDWSKDVAIHRVSPVPNIQTAQKLSEKTCDLFDLPIVISAVDCGGVLLDTLDVDSVVTLVASNFTAVDTITTAKPDTFHLSVYARHPGQQTIRVHIRGRLPEGNGAFDTILKVAISVTTVPQPLAKCARTMSVSNCVPSVVPIILMASPCDSIEYLTCDFTIDPALKYQPTMTFPRTLVASEIDTLKIVFPPQGLSKTSIIFVHLTGRDFQNNQSFDTTLQILVTFSTSGAELDPQIATVDLDTTSMCEVRDTTLTFRNNGCDTVRVTQNTTTWQTGWSADPQSLPITLAPGESFALNVHYAPAAAGPTTQYVSYLLDGSASKGVSSQQVRLSAIGVPGSAILSLPDSAFAFDTMTDCNASGRLLFTLSKSGCDSLLLSNAHLVGSSTFSLDTVSLTSYGVRFAADSAGTYDAQFHIYSVGAQGENAHDTTIAFHAVVMRAPRMATLSTTSVDFGALHYCDTRDTEIAIANPSCKPIDISQLTLASSYFSALVQPPLVIAPYDTLRIPIHAKADSTKSASSAALSFVSNSDIPLPDVAFRSQTIAPEHFALVLSQPELATAGDTVYLSIKRIGTLPATVASIFFSLDYDGDLLTYTNSSEHDVIKLVKTLLPNNLTRSSFEFSPSSDRDVIATFEFTTALSQHLTSEIDLYCDSILVSSTPSDCFVRIDSAGRSSISLQTGCGAKSFEDLLNDRSIEIQQVTASSGSIDFEIVNNGAKTIPMTATVCDVLGRALATHHFDLHPGRTEQTISHISASGALFIDFSGASFHAMKRVLVLPSE